jgi:hypothetical protein
MSAFAQVSASLSGTVSDASGALIPGVEVTAKNVDTGITNTLVTNETGNFVFQSLQPGKYTLTSALTGFKSAVYNNVELGQGQQVRLNFTLQVGGATQSVEVTVAADTLIATTSASVGNVISTRDVGTLPLPSRNVLDFIATTAGVVTTVNAFGAPTPQFGGMPIGAVNTTRDGITTNDGRYNSSNGAYSAIFTSPDMVEEIRVTQNNVDPTLGRGSAQVQMRTRAGTNEFHGAAFYTNNNSVMNAQTYFQNQQRAAKNFANRNQFGARLGGPIIKNKAFFFILTDDQRYLGKLTVNTPVLTAAARQGIFRYSTDHRNGAANAATPSVDANGNLLNPAAVNQFNLFSDVKDPHRTAIDPTYMASYYLPSTPLPNNYQCTGSDGLNVGCFQWLQPQNGSDGATGQSPNTNRNHLTMRFDYQLNSKNKVSFNMTREKNWGVTGQTGLADVPAGAFGQIYRTPYFYTVQYTATLSPTVLNEFRWGRKQDVWDGTSPFDRGCCLFGASNDTRDSISTKIYNSYPQVGGSFLYPVNATGATLAVINPFGVAAPRTTVSPFTDWSDTLSFTKGAHSFSAGFDLNFASSVAGNTGGTQTTRPEAVRGINSAFPSLITTSATYAKGLNASDLTTANAILADLSGSISSLTEQFYINDPKATGWTDYTKTDFFSRGQHENDWNLFFKDNWKATKNVTMIIGMRYDKYGVPYDEFGLAGRYYSSFGAGQAALFGCSGGSFGVLWQPGAGNCASSSPSLTNTEFVGKDSPQPGKLVHGNDWHDFGPSAGLSWVIPQFKRSTVLRAGYGINFSAAPDFLGYNGNLGSFPGNSANITQTTFPTVAGGYLDLAGAVANKASLFPLNTAGTAPFTAIQLNGGSASRTQSITGYADNYKAPYIQSFNLQIQRELTRTLTFDIGWVGNKASRLQTNQALNDVNVQENGILAAFNAVRAGASSVPLMEQIFNGVNLGSGVIGTNGVTAAASLRKSTTFNGSIANGTVGSFANTLNNNATLAPGVNAGKPGGLLLNAGLPQNFIVVSPQFGSVSLANNNGNSTYHSVTAHITKRTSAGLTGQFSYTFSKGLGSGTVRDQRNFALSKGLLGIDRTHGIVSNATYDLPFGNNRTFFAGAPGWLDRVINGWQVSSILSWYSGAPLGFTGVGTLYNTASNTADQLAPLPKGQLVKGNNYVSYWDTLSTQKAPLPNFGGDASLPGVFTNQVLVDASGNTIMQNATPGHLGTMPGFLPTIKGPGQFNFNASATKSIRISEGKTFTLRADAVNVLNKPTWGNPSTNFNGTTFGRITANTGTARMVTLNARIDF